MPTNIPPGAKQSDLTQVVSTWDKFRVVTAQGSTSPASDTNPYDSGYFGPSRPYRPVIMPSQAEAAGVPRVLDYIPGLNLWSTPQRDSGISFDQLDDLSRMWDLLRLVIETKKDLVCKRDFTFRLMGDTNKKRPDDSRFKVLEDLFFGKPDGEHYFDQWVGMIFEDSWKWDAVAIRPQRSYGQVGGIKKGAAYFELLPGNTILRLVEKRGRTPMGKDTEGKFYPAFRQIIKGMPVWDVAAPGQGASEELWYLMRKPATNRLYGFSPVEQLVMTINQGIRRELSKLFYFTEGNMPDYLIPTNPTWSPEQIAQFQALWDALFTGDQAARRKGKFIPGGTGQPHQVKEPPLKDDLDEWYARKVCYCFGMSVNALIRQMNRSTAETSDKQSREEGTEPELKWLGRIITQLVHTYWGWTDIECTVKEIPETDAEKQARVDESDIRNGIVSPQAVAKRKGYEADGKEIIIGAGAQPLERVYEEPAPVPAALAPFAGKPGTGDDGKGGKPPADGKGGATPDPAKPSPFRKSKAGGKVLKRIPRNRKTVRKARVAFVKALKPVFSSARVKASKYLLAAFSALPHAHLAELRNAFQKDEEDPFAYYVQQILDGLVPAISEEFKRLYPKAAEILAAITMEGAGMAGDQIGLEAGLDAIGIANEAARQWAHDRAAEMVGMRLEDGELITNPGAEWAITDGTRDFLRSTVEKAVKEGWSNGQLSEAIEENGAFSDIRAENIARMELANADIQGNLATYRESGMVRGKEWLADENACDECVTNADQGEIGLEEDFESGDDAPPGHNDCECDLMPVLSDETETEGAE